MNFQNPNIADYEDYLAYQRVIANTIRDVKELTDTSEIEFESETL